jgi:hypothetical protein
VVVDEGGVSEASLARGRGRSPWDCVPQAGPRVALAGSTGPCVAQATGSHVVRVEL